MHTRSFPSSCFERRHVVHSPSLQACLYRSPRVNDCSQPYAPHFPQPSSGTDTVARSIALRSKSRRGVAARRNSGHFGWHPVNTKHFSCYDHRTADVSAARRFTVRTSTQERIRDDVEHARSSAVDSDSKDSAGAQAQPIFKGFRVCALAQLCQMQSSPCSRLHGGASPPVYPRRKKLTCARTFLPCSPQMVKPSELPDDPSTFRRVGRKG